MSRNDDVKSAVEQIEEVSPEPSPVEVAAAGCPKLLPAKALDPQLRLEALAEMAAAVAPFEQLDGADEVDVEDDPRTAAEAALAMAEGVKHARAFLRCLAKRPEKFDRWASQLDDDVYSQVILNLFTEQAQLVGKSQGSARS